MASPTFRRTSRSKKCNKRKKKIAQRMRRQHERLSRKRDQRQSPPNVHNFPNTFASPDRTSLSEVLLLVLYKFYNVFNGLVARFQSEKPPEGKHEDNRRLTSGTSFSPDVSGTADTSGSPTTFGTSDAFHTSGALDADIAVDEVDSASDHVQRAAARNDAQLDAAAAMDCLRPAELSADTNTSQPRLAAADNYQQSSVSNEVWQRNNVGRETDQPSASGEMNPQPSAGAVDNQQPSITTDDNQHARAMAENNLQLNDSAEDCDKPRVTANLNLYSLTGDNNNDGSTNETADYNNSLNFNRPPNLGAESVPSLAAELNNFLLHSQENKASAFDESEFPVNLRPDETPDNSPLPNTEILMQPASNTDLFSTEEEHLDLMPVQNRQPANLQPVPAADHLLSNVEVLRISLQSVATEDLPYPTPVSEQSHDRVTCLYRRMPENSPLPNAEILMQPASNTDLFSEEAHLNLMPVQPNIENNIQQYEAAVAVNQQPVNRQPANLQPVPAADILSNVEVLRISLQSIATEDLPYPTPVSEQSHDRVTCLYRVPQGIIHCLDEATGNAIRWTDLEWEFTSSKSFTKMIR